MATTASPIVPELLKKDNYERWKVFMLHYLVAQDLFDVVEVEPSQKLKLENEREWKKKNALALHSIKISCGPKAFNRIKNIESADLAWDTLANHYTEKDDAFKNKEITSDNSPEPEAEKKDADKLLQGLFDDITNGWTYSLKKFVILALKEEDLEKPDKNGNTTLSLAARYGKMDIAKWLVDKNKKLLTIPDKSGKIPLQLACEKGYEEVARFLYRKTPLKSIRHCRLSLFTECMNKKMFDIVLDLLDKFPKLASKFFLVSDDTTSFTAIILMLAQASESPFSLGTGKQLGCLRRFLYHCIPVKANLLKPGTGGRSYQHERSSHSSNKRGVVSSSFFAVKHGLKNVFVVDEGNDEKPSDSKAHKKSDDEGQNQEGSDGEPTSSKAVHESDGESSTARHDMIGICNDGNDRDESCDIETGQPINDHDSSDHEYVDEEVKSSSKVVGIIKGIWKAMKDTFLFVWNAIMMVVGAVVTLIVLVCVVVGCIIGLITWICSSIIGLLPERLQRVIRNFLIAPIVFSLSGLGIIIWFLFMLGIVLVQFLCLTLPVLIIKWIVFELPTLLLMDLPLKLFKYLGIKQVYDLKLKHTYGKVVLSLMCGELENIDPTHLVKSKAVDATFLAIKNGIPEIAIEFTKANQKIVWTQFDLEDHSKNMFAWAVSQRQAEVAQCLYEIEEIVDQMPNFKDEDENNILHITAKLAPDHQLGRISGAALQLQSEVKWFKAVNDIFSRSFNEEKNKDGEVPSQVFIREHKDLQKDAEEWLKKTAESATVVGALIITVMFAAAFTVPGGNNQDTGLPIFSQHAAFKVFIVADAVSLFAASSSVLLFFGILTSRYAWEDFLKSLPLKLLMGLSSLFISIATMMAAFCSALFIMLQGQLWMVVPITLLAGVPVTFFILLQFPIFVEIYTSTFRSDIFHKKISFGEFLIREWQRLAVLVVTSPFESLIHKKKEIQDKYSNYSSLLK